MRLSPIKIDSGFLDFTVDSEMYGHTHACGSVQLALRQGMVALGDGNDYVFSRLELDEMAMVAVNGGDGVIPRIENPVLHALSLMNVDENRISLPTHTKLKCYPKVKTLLQKAGGKYRDNGFVFESPAQNVYDQLLAGEIVYPKKQFQFYESTSAVVELVAAKADIQPDERILEPSAGRGALVDVISPSTDDFVLVEYMPENIRALRDMGHDVVEGDFLLQSPEGVGYFNKILANPPFAKDQDIRHIQHMYQFLVPGGRLVSVASTSWQHPSNNAQREFVEWLNVCGAQTFPIEKGAFAESGTQVGAVLIVINKPDNKCSELLKTNPGQKDVKDKNEEQLGLPF